MTPAEHVSRFLRAAAGDRGALPEREQGPGDTEPMDLDPEAWARRRRSGEEAARELEEMHQRPPFARVPLDEHFEAFDQEDETKVDIRSDRGAIAAWAEDEERRTR